MEPVNSQDSGSSPAAWREGRLGRTGYGTTRRPGRYLKGEACSTKGKPDLIARGKGGPALLDSFGVPQSKFLTTGDEAIQLAYTARASQAGEGVGINLRVALYSGVNSDKIEHVGAVVRDFARRRSIQFFQFP